MGKRWLVYTNLNNSHVDVVLLYGMYTWNDRKQGNGLVSPSAFYAQSFIYLWDEIKRNWYSQPYIDSFNANGDTRDTFIWYVHVRNNNVVSYWKRYSTLVIVLSKNKCSLSLRIFSYCAQIYVINGGYLPPNVYIMRSALMCNIEYREFLWSMFLSKDNVSDENHCKKIVWRYYASNIIINTIKRK